MLAKHTPGLSLRLRGGADALGGDDAFAFADGVELSGGEVFELFRLARGPADFDEVGLRVFAEAEVEPEVVLRKVARAAAYLFGLRPVGGDDADARADG
jgi:hypothetical protein